MTMRKISWKETEASLRQESTGKAVRPREDFWADFRARAALRNQDAPVPAQRPWNPRLALAATCAIVLIAAGTITFYGGFSPAGGTNRIQSLGVKATHSAVMIMDDKETQSTILWIVDMETEGMNGNSS